MLVATPAGEIRIGSQLLGEFNAYNLLAALGVLLALDVPLTDAAHALGKIEAAPGRLQTVSDIGQPLVVVDYAHTPDALEKVLSTLQAIKPAGGKLYCVFGCGGDRDPGKRPLMGKAAAWLADVSVVTSDNPRSEEPVAILHQILQGTIAGETVRAEPDRAAAIALAIGEADAADVVGATAHVVDASERQPRVRRARARSRAGRGSRVLRVVPPDPRHVAPHLHQRPRAA